MSTFLRHDTCTYDGLLIIFPSFRQTEILCSDLFYNKNIIIYIVLQENDNSHRHHNENIIFVKKQDASLISLLQVKKLKVLCCHEEAVFWAGKYGGNKWQYTFNTIYFTLLEKDKFKTFALDKNIPVGHYELLSGNIESYPVIVKPSIGFGSIGVRLITKQSELEEYIEQFDSMIREFRIYSYQKEYFEKYVNRPIFETIIEGDFYRTPFIVKDGLCDKIFPILGVKKRKRESTDFNWIEFEYSPAHLSYAMKKILTMHNRIINAFNLQNGIYISEFIISKIGEPFLLEFSPRQPSGRISSIIYFSTGLDLEAEALNYFIMPHSMQTKSSGQECTIRLRLQVLSVKNPSPEEYMPVIEELSKSAQEVSVHGERIKCEYFRRKD